MHLQREPRPLDGRTKRARQISRDGTQIAQLVRCLYPPRLDTREIQQRIDELEQAQRIALGYFEALAGHRGRLLVGQSVLNRSEQQRQRSAELVADVGEEGRFCSIDRGETFGARALMLIRLRVGDGRGHLRAHQIEEFHVRLVKRSAGTDSHQQNAGKAILATDFQRHHEAMLNEIGPGVGR